jgi:protein-disulfide isomerase
MFRSLALTAIVAFCVAAHAGPDDRPVMRSDLDGLVHDYLLAHPEVIAEAQKALLTRRIKDVLRENKAALLSEPGDSEIGNPQGDVTIVEFFDDECPFCKLLNPALDQLLASDRNIRLVLKEFPVLGPMSEVAARYALAAKKQGRYAAFHAALMADKTPEHKLTEAHIIEIAGAQGLDTGRLTQDSQSPDVLALINRNRALGRTIGFTGTPGLVIGDTVQSGALPFDALAKAVAQVRASAH